MDTAGGSDQVVSNEYGSSRFHGSRQELTDLPPQIPDLRQLLSTLSGYYLNFLPMV